MRPFLCSLIALAIASAAPAAPKVYKVSPKGTGVASLEGARDNLRLLRKRGKLPKGPIVVELAAGYYELDHPFELTSEDSGTADAPITYRAARGAVVRIVGGRVVNNWKPVTDAAALARLDPSAREHVVCADLHALGLTDLPSIELPAAWAQSSPGVELIYNNEPMTLSRWPNEGWAKIAGLTNEKPFDVRGTKGDMAAKFYYDGDRPNRWKAEPEIVLEGYWCWDWADQRQRVESIDTDKKLITLAEPHHVFGYRQNQWWYATNLLCELDSPGEYYVDRASGLLYFWPTAPVAGSHAVVSALKDLVKLAGARYVTLAGLTLEACRGIAITANDSDHVKIAGCTIRNIGGTAVVMSGGESGVQGCDIYQVGEGGVFLSGGDRRSLTHCNLYADNNHIHHYSRWNPVYKPAVSLQGCGCRCSHNLIDNAPHMAINWGGNDHLIEFNEIHSVCFETNDAGAMYAGRDWTFRGTVIRNNYLHHIYGRNNEGCVGVYLDDLYSSAQITGNVFYDVHRAAFIGGGRDNEISNNIFVDCDPAVHIDCRGLNWAASMREGLESGLKAQPYTQSPWKDRYPQLLTLLDNKPMAPMGNVVARNICTGGDWDEFENGSTDNVTFTDNMLVDDPHFVDRAKGNFQLKPDAPAFAKGFQRIPFDKIGCYKSAERASWPVTSPVRPKP